MNNALPRKTAGNTDGWTNRAACGRGRGRAWTRGLPFSCLYGFIITIAHPVSSVFCPVFIAFPTSFPPRKVNAPPLKQRFARANKQNKITKHYTPLCNCLVEFFQNFSRGLGCEYQADEKAGVPAARRLSKTRCFINPCAGSTVPRRQQPPAPGHSPRQSPPSAWARPPHWRSRRSRRGSGNQGAEGP